MRWKLLSDESVNLLLFRKLLNLKLGRPRILGRRSCRHVHVNIFGREHPDICRCASRINSLLVRHRWHLHLAARGERLIRRRDRCSVGPAPARQRGSITRGILGKGRVVGRGGHWRSDAMVGIRRHHVYRKRSSRRRCDVDLHGLSRGKQVAGRLR